MGRKTDNQAVLDMALTLHMHVTGALDAMDHDQAEACCKRLEARLHGWNPAPLRCVAFDGAVRLVCEVAVADFKTADHTLAVIRRPFEKWSVVVKGKRRYTGTRCSVCNGQQYETPSGATCDEGHGGE